MISDGFIAGAKQGLMAIRNSAYDAETALDCQNTGDLSRAVTRLLGDTLTSATLILSRLAYEASEAENVQDNPRKEEK